MGSGSSSSGRNPKEGDNYTGKLYFEPEADKKQGTCYYINDSDILNTMSKVANINEKIIEVTVYTHPLNWWQVTDMYLFHAFVVFETENYWWSIEKNSEGITIQRSKTLKYVRDWYRADERVNNPLHYAMYFTWKFKASGSGSVEDLLQVVYRENLLSNTYHYMTDNCKSFAARIFNRSSTATCTVSDRMCRWNLVHPRSLDVS